MIKHRLTLLLLPTLLLVTACGHRNQPAGSEKRYPIEGEIVSVDKAKNLLTVKHGDIPGYMQAMTMPYPAAAPKDLEGLAAGDRIRAELVVEKGAARLEKISVLSKAGPQPAAAPASQAPGKH